MFIGDLFSGKGVTEGATVSYIVTYINLETNDRGESTVSALTKDDAAKQVKSMLAKKGYDVTVYRVRPEYEVNESKQVDMTGKKCKSCGKGSYQETSPHDDMDGVLHCNKCNAQVNRWQAYKEKPTTYHDDGTPMDVAEDMKSDLYAMAIHKIKTALQSKDISPKDRADLERRLHFFTSNPDSQINELSPDQKEPESIDSKVKELTARIKDLEKEKRPEADIGTTKTTYGQVRDPGIKKMLRKAYEYFPSAKSDLEAIVKYVEKIVEKDDETMNMLVKNHKRNAQLIKFLQGENDKQEQEIEQGTISDQEQNKKIKDLLDLMNAKEKRFQDYTAMVARSRGEYPQDMVKAAQTAQHVERTGRMPDEQELPQGQQQAQRQLQQSKFSKELPVDESVLRVEEKYYFNPIGTLPNKLFNEFGFKKDDKGWYLPKYNTSSREFIRLLSQARRAFGEPKVQVAESTRFENNHSNDWQAKIEIVKRELARPENQYPEAQKFLKQSLQQLNTRANGQGR